MELPRSYPGSAFTEYYGNPPQFYSYADAYARTAAYAGTYDVHTPRTGLPAPTFPKTIGGDNFMTSPWTPVTPSTWDGKSDGIGLNRQPEVTSAITQQHHHAKRKRKTTPQQRLAANIRERRRMCNLNNAFDRLRRRVPAFPHEKRLSRIQTLRLAITYISFMTEIVSGQDIQTLIKQNQQNNKHVVWQPYELGESGSESGGSGAGFI